MRTILLLLISTLWPMIALGDLWTFTSAISISKNKKQTFHHLESSGRHNIAVSDNTLAIAWEDERDGIASVYLALKEIGENEFARELKISAGDDSYEPSLVALSNNIFSISWEENGQIFVRLVDASPLHSPKLGKVLKLPAISAMQSSLTTDKNLLFVSYAEAFQGHSRIKLAQLKVGGDLALSLIEDCAVDPESITNKQLYPTAIMVKKKQQQSILVAWEDRRNGHTVIMGTESEVGQYCSFPPLQRISKKEGNRKLPYGKGHGVSRVSLANYGDSGVLASWADKRDFREGYDIYAADYHIDSATWKKNVKVQDDFGGVARQWHAAIAGDNNGNLVSVWSDEREGSSNLFYSWYEDGDWSEDMAVLFASGSGEQNYPSIAFDKNENIHIAWVFRKKMGEHSQLLYIKGLKNKNKQ